MSGGIEHQVRSSGALELQVHEADAVVFNRTNRNDPFLKVLIKLLKSGWHIDINCDDDEQGLTLLPPHIL